MKIEILGSRGAATIPRPLADFRAWPRNVCDTTRIYLPEQVAVDFREWRRIWDHLEFMVGRGWIEVVELTDGEAAELDGTSIRPFRVAEVEV
jgi:hypothetical protein